jgi:hypothetical protein
VANPAYYSFWKYSKTEYALRGAFEKRPVFLLSRISPAQSGISRRHGWEESPHALKIF